MVEPLRNKEITGVCVGVGITLAGVIGIFMPGILGLDMLTVGFGVSFFGAAAAIVGIITALVYGARARKIGRILAGEGILARWSYDEIQSAQQVETEYRRTAGRNRATYWVMAFWFVLIAGGLIGADFFTLGKINWVFAGIIAGVLVLLGIIAAAAPGLWKRRARRASREVLISREGVILNGALHSWGDPANRLVSVKLAKDPAEMVLEFSIRHLSRASLTASIAETVSVPVPADQYGAAQQVVAALQVEFKPA
jgi:hypothetical protein